MHRFGTSPRSGVSGGNVGVDVGGGEDGPGGGRGGGGGGGGNGVCGVGNGGGGDCGGGTFCPNPITGLTGPSKLRPPGCSLGSAGEARAMAK